MQRRRVSREPWPHERILGAQAMAIAECDAHLGIARPGFQFDRCIAWAFGQVRRGQRAVQRAQADLPIAQLERRWQVPGLVCAANERVTERDEV